MKILVAVKRVVDYKAVVRVKADGSNVDTTNVKMSMNPFDEIAMEEAIRLKEKGQATEVIAVTIGAEVSQDVLRTALAMGADRAILIKTTLDIQPLAAAKLLKAVAEQEAVQLILLGKQAIDSDDNQVGQMCAGLLNWPQGTFASSVECRDAGVSVTREIDGGLETLFLPLPAVITTDLRLNEPRYISLPNIMKSKQKPIKSIEAETFSISLTPHLHLLQVATPQKKRDCKRVATVDELVYLLKNEARVI